MDTKKDPPPDDGSDGLSGFETEMDRLSLSSALADFEVANARTIELTQQLVDASQSYKALEQAGAEVSEELVQLRAEHEALKAQYEEVLATKAFRIAKAIWGIRKLIRV